MHKLLLQISQAISQAGSVAAALAAVLEKVCTTMAWEYGEIWLPNETGVLACSPIWYGLSDRLAEFHAISSTLQFPLGTGLPGRVALTGEPEWQPDVTMPMTPLFLRRELAIAANLGAALGVPIRGSDRLLAVLVFFRTTAHPKIESDVDMISAIANQLGALIQLKQVEADLSQSQRRLTTLIDSLPGIVFMATNDGSWSMQYLSQGCQKLTGYGVTELAGPQRQQSYNDITHPDDLAQVLATINTAIAERIPYVVEYRIQTKAGVEKWLWEKGYGIYDEARHPIGLEGFITDITERKVAEQALREQESLLQLILDTIPQCLFWKDQDLVYRGGNRAWLEYATQIFPGYPIGHTDFDLWPIAEAQQFQANDRRVIDQKQPRLHYQRQKVMVDGRKIWQDVSKVPMRNAAGDVIGVLGMFEDITEKRQVEASLIRREQFLAALVQVQQCLLNLSTALDADLYHQLLSILGQVEGVTRVYLYTEVDAVDLDSHGPSVLWALQAEWEHPLLADTDNLDLPPQLHLDQLPPAWRSRLTQQQAVYERDAIAGPAALQALLPSQTNQTLLLLPLFLRGALAGILGFRVETADGTAWEASDIDLLKAAAAAICLAQEHQYTRTSLTQAESKYRDIFENAVEGIFQTTADGHYLTVNSMLARIYGYDSPADLMQNLTNIGEQLYVDPRRRLEFARLMARDGSVKGFESEVCCKDGSIIWISESARALYDERGQLTGYEGTVEDITQRKRAEVELLQRDNLLEGVAKAATCLLTQPDVQAAIHEVLQILGQAACADRAYIYENHPHPVTGQISMSMRFEWTHEAVVPSIHQPHWQNQPYTAFGLQRWYDAFIQRQSIRGIVHTFPAAEQELLNHDHVQAILMVPIFMDEQLWGYMGFDACREERQWSDSDESILVAIAASLGGVFKRQLTEEQMRYQAFHDNLTGLPNRLLFDHHLPLAIAGARRSEEMVGVLFLDLDRFKTINDTLGHTVGDRLLQQATKRLQGSLREEDLVARWGGDEFTLILPHLQQPRDAAKIAQRIIDSFSTPFLIDDHELYVTSSIGIALYPHDGDTPQTLLQNADAALYRAKDQGRNHFQFYTATLNSQASERLRLESSLHHALNLDEFEVWYQPQINLKTGQVEKMEALLRWQHRDLGMISPAKFIPIAEETGLIIPIGTWILREACRQNQRWQALGLPPLRVAVNLSARQFQQPDLAGKITEILAEVGLSPAQLELEITETAAMQDVDFTRRTLQELRSLGVWIAMDDFGTGYSSLSYLKRFPLSTLKIDQSFVRDLIHHPDDEAIVSSIIALGQSFKLSVVAEGVETQAHAQKLYKLGCYEMQGYWLSQPLPAGAATQFLQQQIAVETVLAATTTYAESLISPLL